jgi:predicted alpha/beta hydrolase
LNPVETVDIRTAGGVSLRAEVREPAPEQACGVTAVLAHAMFARRTAFTREPGGLARFLAERGVRTVAFDFRGHGDSGKPARAGFSWSYDDLVTSDLPTVVSVARERFGGTVAVVGHSLGAQVALAGLGRGILPAEGLVALGMSLWHPAVVGNPVQQRIQRAAVRVLGALGRRVGYVPVRALRLGSDDECLRYFRTVERVVLEGRWCSEDLQHDYFAGLAAVRVPVLALSSRGDSTAPPAAVAGLLSRLGGPTEHCILREGDGGRPAPNHGSLATGPFATAAWSRAATFLRSLALPADGGTTR